MVVVVVVVRLVVRLVVRMVRLAETGAKTGGETGPPLANSPTRVVCKSPKNKKSTQSSKKILPKS